MADKKPWLGLKPKLRNRRWVLSCPQKGCPFEAGPFRLVGDATAAVVEHGAKAHGWKV